VIPTLNQIIETDVLVLGGGAAGVRAAIEARRQDAEVMIVATYRAGYSSNTAISFGGFSATDPEKDKEDSPELHFEDTLKGGCELNRPFLVRILTNQIWPEVETLEAMGAHLLKDSHGKHVRLARGGHSVPRRLATFNSNGMALLSPLLKRAKQMNVVMMDGFKAVSLLKKGEQICGALLIDRKGEWSAIAAKSVILATGGGGALYPKTTNVPSAIGDGYALAYRAGLSLHDMEFVQFVVRTLKDPGVPKRLSPVEVFLLKGAKLKNAKNENLMDSNGSPHSFTRDAVAQVVAREIERGEGKQDFVYLDIKDIPQEERRQMGIPKIELLKISPASHFFMGGIWVDEHLGTPIEGLYVAGEVMGGVHGANRLGGNALAETFVFGTIAGSLAAKFAGKCGKGPLLKLNEGLESARAIIEGFGQTGETKLSELELALKNIMGESAGIIRDKGRLDRGIQRLETLKQSFYRLPIGKPEKCWSMLGFQNKLEVCEMILKSALKREETRGAHYREDFPAQNDESWRVNIRVSRDESGQMKLSSVPVSSSA
jgi:fumarate reductase (CoM/CoB) subunit A